MLSLMFQDKEIISDLNLRSKELQRALAEGRRVSLGKLRSRGSKELQVEAEIKAKTANKLVRIYKFEGSGKVWFGAEILTYTRNTPLKKKKKKTDSTLVSDTPIRNKAGSVYRAFLKVNEIAPVMIDEDFRRAAEGQVRRRK